MKLAGLFRRNPHREAALALYHRIVEQARERRFFAELGVPDTLDGRFEMVSLHAFLVLNRLKGEREGLRDLSQSLFDIMFADLDRSLREMGAGDLGVGRHVKQMATAFYGRIVAYEQGLAGDDAALEAAIARNLYGTGTAQPGHAATVAAYLRTQRATLALVPLADLMRGDIRFAPLETEAG